MGKKRKPNVNATTDKIVDNTSEDILKFNLTINQAPQQSNNPMVHQQHGQYPMNYPYMPQMGWQPTYGIPPPPPYPFYPYGGVQIPNPPPLQSQIPSLPPGYVPPWKLPQPPKPNPAKGIKFNVNETRKAIPVTPASKSIAEASVKPTVTPQATSTPGQWPPSLRAYVDKCFASCKTEMERDKIEAALKVRIQSAIKANNLYSHDWSQEALLGKSVDSHLLHQQHQTQTSSFVSTSISSQLMSQRQQRAKRFQSDEDLTAKNNEREQEARKIRKKALLAMAEEGVDWDEFTIIGTSQSLEKPYLRLTSAPDPATVRPLPVLRRVLEYLKGKWKKGKVEYGFICDQFKSLRQDLTVQRIRNEFTVQVYEIHARIALEKGDLGEYNQCQTQLKTLYFLNIPGNEHEFLAYRILYLLHTRNRQEMNSLLADITVTQKADPAVQHALRTRSALALCNYTSFFKLYQEAPNMGAYLMDYYVKRERMSALSTICRAYRPTIELEYVKCILAFETVQECHSFLSDCNATIINNNSVMDTKSSLSVFL